MSDKSAFFNEKRYFVFSFADKKVMFLSDVHLGLEWEFFEHGFRKIPQITAEILGQLLKEVKTENPTDVVINGDLFHSFRHFGKDVRKKPRGNLLRTNRWHRQRVFSYFLDFAREVVKSGHQLHVIKGNHDIGFFREPIEIPRLTVYSHYGIKWNDVGIWHGHFPNKKMYDVNYAILGHLHPAIMVTLKNKERKKSVRKKTLSVLLRGEITRRDWLRLLGVKLPKNDNLSHRNEEREKKIATNLKVIILPCYNKYQTGRPINRPKNRLLGGGSYRFIQTLLEKADIEIFLPDFTYIGNLKDLMKNPSR